MRTYDGESQALGSGQIQGARSSQEDSFLLEPLADKEAVLVVVADGMGGHADGAFASRTGVAAFRDAFLASRGRSGDLEKPFDKGLSAANAALASGQRGRPDRKGTGTTLLAAVVSPQGLAWVSVGDTMLLLYREGSVRRLNEDHSCRAVSSGPGSNMLRSAVAGGEIPIIDRHPVPMRLSRDDRIVLATDGILSLSMDRLADLLDAARTRSAQETVDMIIAAVDAAAVPKQDNCSLVVINPPSPPRAHARQDSRLRLPLMLVLGLVVAGATLLVLFW